MASKKSRDEYKKLLTHASVMVTMVFAKGGEEEKLREYAKELLDRGNPNGGEPRKPFHWLLEFPEVFMGNGRPHCGFDAIVGNPPFMGGQKITGALGTDYRDFLVTYLAGGKRGSADICAYFFLRAAEILRNDGGFGLLATNTIAQGDTREVGLEQLMHGGNSVIRAVPSRKWPGMASLEVAHIWVRKGEWKGGYVLEEKKVPGITPLLNVPGKAVGKPYRLAANAGKSFQGSIVLGMGFVLTPEEAQALIEKDPRNREVLFPYLNGEDLNSRPDQSPSRWVINFHDWPLERAEVYPDCMSIVRERAKPERDKLANGDATAKDRARRWWQFARQTMNLYSTIEGMKRVLAVPLVSKFMVTAWESVDQVFSHALGIIAFDNGGAFALTQSSFHDDWSRYCGSTLETRMRYTPSDCFETFPFPDSLPGLESIGERYYSHRQQIMLARQEGLTQTYNRFHNPDEPSGDISNLRKLHIEMDYAVAKAYGWGDLALGHNFHETKQALRFTLSEPARREVLDRLLLLNHARYEEEVRQGLHEKGKKSKKKKDRDSDNCVQEADNKKHTIEKITHLKLFG